MASEKKKRIPLLKILVLTAALAVFVYSGFRLLHYYLDNRNSIREQQVVIDQAVVMLPPQTEAAQPQQIPGAPDESVVPTEPPMEMAPIYVDFETLQAQNLLSGQPDPLSHRPGRKQPGLSGTIPYRRVYSQRCHLHGFPESAGFQRFQ